MKTSRRKIAIEPLSFSLFQRAVHPELFNIYRQFEFGSKRFDATLWVTRQCHVLTICVESMQITELIATAGQPLPSRSLLAKFQLPGAKKHTHVFGNNLKYQCEFAITESGLAEHRKQHGELTCRGDKKTMVINFPQLSSESRPAFTFIETESTQNEFNIQTVHSRPGRGELITTKTTIDLSEIR